MTREENKKTDPPPPFMPPPPTSISTNHDENNVNNNNDLNTYSSYYWKELYAVLSSFGLVLLSYAIVLYLVSYEKSECPSPPPS